MRTEHKLAKLLAAILLTAAPASAAPRWTPLGPFGGVVRTLTADPSRSGILYATTPNGIFKTVDRGNSWTSIYTGMPASNVAVDPVHPATLYVAATGPILLKSADGGVHWTPSAGGLPPDPTFTPRQVAVDPANPSRLLLTYGFGLWRSADAGASWQPANAGLPADSTTPTYGIVWASPAGTALVATQGGVYRSPDGGLSWHLASGLPTLGVDALAVDPSDPRTVYADFGGTGLYRSADGGASWQRITAAAPFSVALVVSPHAPRTLYSTSNALVSKSTDGGAHWSPLAGAPRVQILAADAGAGATVYAGSSSGPLGGAFRSDDGGATWTRQSRGMSGVATVALAVDPESPERLWTSTGFVFRSANRGGGWIRLPAAPQGSDTLLAVGRGGRAFATCQVFSRILVHALCATTDDGASWPQVLSANDVDVRELRVSSSNPSTLYVAGPSISQGLKLYRSTDDGATWEARAAGGSLPLSWLGDLAVAPSSAAVVYLAGATTPPGGEPTAAVLRSGDGGATWTDVSAGLPAGIASRVTVDPHDPDFLYAGTGVPSLPGDGVWKSADGGRTWSRAGGELAGRTITALLAAAPPGRVYAAFGGRVFRSDDGGASWQGWSLGLHAVTIEALVADPSDASRIYAVTSNGDWVLNESD
jgi:photosystem II stability/assembly factor-like uncharacterized protein